jgi:hypothetical protein
MSASNRSRRARSDPENQSGAPSNGDPIEAFHQVVVELCEDVRPFTVVGEELARFCAVAARVEDALSKEDWGQQTLMSFGTLRSDYEIVWTELVVQVVNADWFRRTGLPRRAAPVPEDWITPDEDDLMPDDQPRMHRAARDWFRSLGEWIEGQLRRGDEEGTCTIRVRLIDDGPDKVLVSGMPSIERPVSGTSLAKLFRMVTRQPHQKHPWRELQKAWPAFDEQTWKPGPSPRTLAAYSRRIRKALKEYAAYWDHSPDGVIWCPPNAEGVGEG